MAFIYIKVCTSSILFCLAAEKHILLSLLFYQAAKAVFSMFSPAEEIIELLSPSQNNPHSFKIT